MKNELKAHISKGNSKVGRIPNFSLTPGISCSAEACRTCLKEGCYACKSYRQYPNVRRAWDENTTMSVDFLNYLILEINDWLTKHKPTYFRIHVGGDFITHEYAEAWAYIASKHPETRFLAFTKQWDNIRGVSFPDNVSIVLSAWRGCSIPEDLKQQYAVAYVSDCDDVPENAIPCGGNCETCHACWGLAKRGLNVVFDKH